MKTNQKRLRHWTVNSATPSLLALDLFTEKTDSLCKQKAKAVMKFSVSDFNMTCPLWRIPTHAK